MYKSLWVKMLACLTVVVMLSLSILPLMTKAEDLNGEPWGKYSTTFTPQLEINDPNWISKTELETILWIVYDAYQGGMFGGAYPYAIALENSGSSKMITIYTINHSPFTAFPSFTQEDFFENQNTVFDLARIDIENEFSAGWMSGLPVQYTEFILSETGNFIVYQSKASFQAFTSSTSFLAINKRINPSINGTSITAEEMQAGGMNWCYFSETSTTPPIMSQTIPTDSTAPAEFTQKINSINWAIAVNASVFDDGYNDGYDDGRREGREQGFQSGYDEGYDAGFDPGYRQGYDDGYTEGVATVPPVTLDIPHIFTALFGATHDILGGFDISIFGISIVGLLVAIIVITVVSFLIKKLLK